MAFCSGQRLYLRLRQHYWWRGMKADCEAVVKKSLPSRQEGARYPPPKYLYPIPKTHRPFAEWSIDCVTNLKPPDSKGRTAAVVAVDVFTKWVEAAPLDDMSSHGMYQTLHQMIVCRYGMPIRVRADRGMEFWGDVSTYFAACGV